MSEVKLSWLKEIVKAPLLSPRGFVVRAVLIALLFLSCQLLGWREHTTFLTGTPATAGIGFNVSVVLGVIYIVAWLGFVLLTPILLLAASLLLGWARFSYKGERARLARSGQRPVDQSKRSRTLTIR